MLELAPDERLQPALLDRLRDDHPEQTRESLDNRVISESELRQSVIRDLEWLLNAENLATVTDLDAHPEVARSVVNYGVAGLSGRMVSSADSGDIRSTVREAILNFEPRILEKSLEVDVQADSSAMNRNRIVIEIRGELWGSPVPLEFLLLTELDVDTGDVFVTDAPQT